MLIEIVTQNIKHKIY